MHDLRLSVRDADGRPDLSTIQALLLDLRGQVDAAAYAPGPADPGAKGAGLDLSALAIGLLSSSSLNALIGVLQAYLTRGAQTEIIVEGPGGKVSLKGSAAARLEPAALHAMLRQALDPRPAPT